MDQYLLIPFLVGMNIHLPAILGFTRYQGFDPSPYEWDSDSEEQVHLLSEMGKVNIFLDLNMGFSYSGMGQSIPIGGYLSQIWWWLMI